MEGQAVTIADAAGQVIARGHLGTDCGGRFDLLLNEGADGLRAAYFLAGLRHAHCRVGEVTFEGRLFTRWESNRRCWSLALPVAAEVSHQAVAAA